MKQISWLSGLSATGQAVAAARTRGPRPSARSPTGKTRARQLLLRQREQEIGLILRRIDAAPEQVAVRSRRRARRARSGRSRPRRRRSRARGRAASRTSGRCCSARRAAASGPRRTRGRSSRRPARRTAARSSGCSAGCRSPPPRAGRRAGRRASSSCRTSVPSPAGLIVELHRQTDDLVALLGEQRRGHRRVDAARHGDDDSHRSRFHEITKSRRHEVLLTVVQSS